MPIISDFRYRPEVDGLRAVAVLAVVLSHAGLSCTGGYVGVDVFFVISGFLITSLIWKDLEGGGFTFAHFWERRARRIVPAMVVLTLATLVAGWFLLLPRDYKSLGKASVAQAVFAANIHYNRNTAYFLGSAEEKPLLHTWSLAVEEQFYLVVPFLLWGLFRSRRLRSRTAVLPLLLAGLVVSFGLSVYGMGHHQNATFYLLPTRAWELLCGAVVAFLPTFPMVSGRRSLRELLALSGLGLILVPVFLYTRQTPFPGLAALPPCLGAALLIWANGPARTLVASLLSVRPVVFIGLISYSLYLWHWPFLAFSKYLAYAPLTVGYRVAMVGCGLSLAVLSWKYVETPFRRRKWGVSQKSMYAFAGAGLALVLGAGLLSILQVVPQRMSPQAAEVANAATDFAFTNEVTVGEVRAGKFIPIGARGATLRPAVLVWGDSHAMAALPAIDAFLAEKGVAGRAATHSSTAPVLGWSWSNGYIRREEVVVFNESVFSYIQREKIPTVILVANWGTYGAFDGDHSAAFDASLLATVRRLVAAGAHPWIMLDVPVQSFDVPRALARHSDAPVYLDAICVKPTVRDEIERNDPTLIAALQAAGGGILDPKPRFLDRSGQHYIIESKGVVLYRDTGHLTTKGAKLMLLPLLRDSLTLEAPVP